MALGRALEDKEVKEVKSAASATPASVVAPEKTEIFSEATSGFNEFYAETKKTLTRALSKISETASQFAELKEQINELKLLKTELKDETTTTSILENENAALEEQFTIATSEFKRLNAIANRSLEPLRTLPTEVKTTLLDGLNNYSTRILQKKTVIKETNLEKIKAKIKKYFDEKYGDDLFKYLAIDNSLLQTRIRSQATIPINPFTITIPTGSVTDFAITILYKAYHTQGARSQEAYNCLTEVFKSHYPANYPKSKGIALIEKIETLLKKPIEVAYVDLTTAAANAKIYLASAAETQPKTTAIVTELTRLRKLKSDLIGEVKESVDRAVVQLETINTKIDNPSINPNDDLMLSNLALIEIKKARAALDKPSYVHISTIVADKANVSVHVANGTIKIKNKELEIKLKQANLASEEKAALEFLAEAEKSFTILEEEQKALNHTDLDNVPNIGESRKKIRQLIITKNAAIDVTRLAITTKFAVTSAVSAASPSSVAAPPEDDVLDNSPVHLHSAHARTPSLPGAKKSSAPSSRRVSIASQEDASAAQSPAVDNNGGDAKRSDPPSFLVSNSHLVPNTKPTTSFLQRHKGKISWGAFFGGLMLAAVGIAIAAFPSGISQALGAALFYKGVAIAAGAVGGGVIGAAFGATVGYHLGEEEDARQAGVVRRTIVSGGYGGVSTTTPPEYTKKSDSEAVMKKRKQPPTKPIVLPPTTTTTVPIPSAHQRRASMSNGSPSAVSQPRDMPTTPHRAPSSLTNTSGPTTYATKERAKSAEDRERAKAARDEARNALGVKVTRSA